MSNAIKGALLSGLVLPGLGQMVLKHYKKGLALMLVVLGSLTVMIIKAAQLALSIFEKMELEGSAIDMQEIAEAATRASATFDSRLFNFCLLLIVVCWIGSVVDAYLIGKKMDAAQAEQ